MSSSCARAAAAAAAAGPLVVPTVAISVPPESARGPAAGGTLASVSTDSAARTKGKGSQIPDPKDLPPSTLHAPLPKPPARGGFWSAFSSANNSATELPEANGRAVPGGGTRRWQVKIVLTSAAVNERRRDASRGLAQANAASRAWSR